MLSYQSVSVYTLTSSPHYIPSKETQWLHLSGRGGKKKSDS